MGRLKLGTPVRRLFTLTPVRRQEHPIGRNHGEGACRRGTDWQIDSEIASAGLCHRSLHHRFIATIITSGSWKHFDNNVIEIKGADHYSGTHLTLLLPRSRILSLC